MRGVTVTVPEAAKARLAELELLRNAGIDAAKAAQQRIMLPADAPPGFRTRLETERDKHTRCQNDFHRLYSACCQYLVQLRLPPGQELQTAAPVAVEVPRGETVFEAIDAIRHEIAGINQQIVAVRRAPLRKSSQEEALGRYLASQAMRVRPRVGFDAQGNAKVLWNEDLVHTKDDILGVLAWFMGGPAELMAAFDLDAGPESENALTPDERAQQLRARQRISARFRAGEIV
jgi:hypothetical protein